jgi:L-cysteine:1D-myo-inositol 2-amino-2-deoxy-alpha-D-glucopyranoside ligase
MQLFNSLTRAKDEFTATGDVKLYVCGITPYDTTHLGHARTYLVFDVLVRQLMHHGWRVKYVQNITDVDDSILERAREVGESYRDLGDRHTSRYLEDVAALGMIPAAVYPRATDAIEEMHEVIARLLNRGHAYVLDGGDIFYRAGSWSEFGRLSRLSREQMMAIEANQDGTTIDDPRKEDPLDWPLWVSETTPDASWPSPWGAGRPGWHLECSTLAIKHLGRQIDIHGGGDDLIYPHHECEIAQSEAVSGARPFSRFWIHVAMARLDGHKMSKSEGNMVFVRDLLARFPPDALRLYLLSTHYRAPLDYEEQGLHRAQELATAVASAARLPIAAGGTTELPPDDYVARFDAALDDDLNAPAAIEVLRSMTDDVLESWSAGTSILAARRALRVLASRLGLQLEVATPRPW